jgi:hypothetical protein
MKMEIFSPSSRKIMGKMPKRGEKSARKIYFSFISALDVCVWKIAFPFFPRVDSSQKPEYECLREKSPPR